MQTRRDFLKTTATAGLALSAGTAGVCTPAAPDSAKTEEWRNRQSDMRYRRLGRTNFMISRIVMGGNEIAPDNYEHVFEAMDMGLNYLDTAPAYGRGASELGFADIIMARPRDQFFLNTKVSLWDINRNQLYRDIFDSLPDSEQKKWLTRVKDEIEARGTANPEYFGHYWGGQAPELDAATLSNRMEREYGRKIDREKNYKQLILDSVDQSLAQLGTDYLDLLMCPHGASSPEEMKNYPEIFDAFDILKRQGKVGHLGVSAHSDPAGVLNAAIDTGEYAVAMVAYNVVNHTYLDAALDRARKNDVGTIAMKVARPVCPGRKNRAGNAKGIAKLEKEIKGDWTLPQRAYVWALQKQSLTAVISNMVNSEQVADNVPLPAKLDA